MTNSSEIVYFYCFMSSHNCDINIKKGAQIYMYRYVQNLTITLKRLASVCIHMHIFNCKYINHQYSVRFKIQENDLHKWNEKVRTSVLYYVCETKKKRKNIYSIPNRHASWSIGRLFPFRQFVAITLF